MYSRSYWLSGIHINLVCPPSRERFLPKMVLLRTVHVFLRTMYVHFGFRSQIQTVYQGVCVW